MPSAQFESIARELSQNVFVDQNQVAQVRELLQTGNMSEQTALDRLKAIRSTAMTNPLAKPASPKNDEWEQLSLIIQRTETSALRRARFQYFLGVLAIPLAVGGSLASLLLGWQSSADAPVIGSGLTLTILASAAYSFILLRLQQQSSLAAERLAEKRVGLMFIRLAMNQLGGERGGALLNAGTAMFLGHHAPATVPLTAEDIKMAGKVLRS